MIPAALSIAGSDPSGGAGIQADLKTFHRFRVYGEAVITLITVQNTRGTARVETLSADLVRDQIRAVLEDIPPQAAKTGALGSRETVKAIASEAKRFAFPLVVDPVLLSTSGARLLDEDAMRALAGNLIPQAFLLTPNLAEAAALSGLAVCDRDSMLAAARELVRMGAANVLVKGGHLPGDALDLLLTASGEIHEFTAPRIATLHTHGSGCTYSAAITAALALGDPLPSAVARAKDFVTAAIRTAPGLGSSHGPLNHLA